LQPDIQNVEVPDWIAGGSALVLLITLFLPWVRVSIGGGGIKVTGTSGASFGWVSIISVLAVFAMVLITLFDVEVPFPSGLVYLGAGALSVLFTVLVMLFRPIGTSGFTVSGISKIPWYGSWFGLLAGIGIIVAGFLKFQEQRY
jgi:hypothetical protein